MMHNDHGREDMHTCEHCRRAGHTCKHCEYTERFDVIVRKDAAGQVVSYHMMRRDVADQIFGGGAPRVAPEEDDGHSYMPFIG